MEFEFFCATDTVGTSTPSNITVYGDNISIFRMSGGTAIAVDVSTSPTHSSQVFTYTDRPLGAFGYLDGVSGLTLNTASYAIIDLNANIPTFTQATTGSVSTITLTGSVDCFGDGGGVFLASSAIVGFRYFLYTRSGNVLTLLQEGNAGSGAVAPHTIDAGTYYAIPEFNFAVLGSDYGGLTIISNKYNAIPRNIFSAGTQEAALDLSPANQPLSAYSINTGSVASYGDVLSSGGSIGNSTGAGGTVTQATSKTTAVTLNKSCGVITTHAASLAAGAIARFQINNSLLSAYDVVSIHRASGGTNSAYNVWVDSISAGSCYVCIQNITGAALAEAVALNFSFVKGVAA